MEKCIDESIIKILFVAELRTMIVAVNRCALFIVYMCVICMYRDFRMYALINHNT